MGASLSEPVTEKESESFTSSHYVVQTSSMQGWRPQMEDACCVHLNEPDALLGVFDGHGSQKFSQACSDDIHQHLIKLPEYIEGKYEEALKKCFLTFDSKLRLVFENEPGGTTAVVVLIKNNFVYCANAGDSRAIACVNGEPLELSHDHKPTNPDETLRITSAGGWVEMGRANGNLALSRAIGDYSFKNNSQLEPEAQVITASPDVKKFPLSESWEFIVLACDGIWDVMTNKEVTDYIYKRLASNQSLKTICESMLNHCLAPDVRMGGIGCDNMTIVLVCRQPLSKLADQYSITTTLTHHHSLTHTSRNITPTGDSEERLTFGAYSTSPQSKLNDTVSGANTDLDCVMNWSTSNNNNPIETMV